ncbi:MAG TPA: hypothetical protein VF828_01700 [Patescibacteria group bacterium]
MEQDRPVSRATMPAEIQQAYQLMKDSPIPENEGYFGKDSCYVLGVEDQLVD